MAHCNSVVDRNGIKFFCDTARAFNFSRYQLSQILEMDMSWYELRERVNDGNDGFFKIAIFHASCTPQGTGASHISAGGGCS